MMTEHGRSIMKRNGLSLLLALITLLTACAPIQQENPFASIPTVEGTQVANPEKTPTQGLPEEIPGNPQGIDPPVTISFVKNQWTSDAEIITVGLTGDLNYSAIPVKRETVLKSLPAIDQDGSVFLLYGTNYGANSTFFSRLGIDGSIDTINVPVSGPIVDTVWIGNRLFINRKTLLIVNTDMRAYIPDYIFVPAGNGTMLLGAYIGFRELGKLPRIIAVQSRNCAPVAAAFHGRTPEPLVPTVAEGIAIGQPMRLPEMVAAVRESHGDFITVDDDSVLRAQELLGGMGIYIEPTAGAAVAGMLQCFPDDDRGLNIVVPLTGSGLKK